MDACTSSPSSRSSCISLLAFYSVPPILFYTCHQLSRILKCCCFPLSTLPLLSPWFSYGHHGNCLQMVGGSEHCIGGVERGYGGKGTLRHLCWGSKLWNISVCSLTHQYVRTVYDTYTANTHALSTTNALMSILSLSLSHTHTTQKHSVHLTGTNKLSVQEHYSWEAYQWKQGFTTTCWVKHKENKLMRNLAWMGKEMQHANASPLTGLKWFEWEAPTIHTFEQTEMHRLLFYFPACILYYITCCVGFFCLHLITVDKSVYSKGGIRNKAKQL